MVSGISSNFQFFTAHVDWKMKCHASDQRCEMLENTNRPLGKKRNTGNNRTGAAEKISVKLLPGARSSAKLGWVFLALRMPSCSLSRAASATRPVERTGRAYNSSYTVRLVN